MHEDYWYDGMLDPQHPTESTISPEGIQYGEDELAASKYVKFFSILPFQPGNTVYGLSKEERSAIYLMNSITSYAYHIYPQSIQGLYKHERLDLADFVCREALTLTRFQYIYNIINSGKSPDKLGDYYMFWRDMPEFLYEQNELLYRASFKTPYPMKDKPLIYILRESSRYQYLMMHLMNVTIGGVPWIPPNG